MTHNALLTDFHADGTYDTLHQGIRRQVKALGLEKVWKDAFTAYLLATVKHETAGTFRPIDEIGGKQTRYAPFFGRGFVQLTWRKNYQKYNDLLQLDLVANPSIALRSDVSLFILVHGCYFGIFTGRGFNDFDSPGPDDFEEMRKIVNGTDRAELIAGYARKFLTANTVPSTPKSPSRVPMTILKEKVSARVPLSPVPPESLPIPLEPQEALLPIPRPDGTLLAFLAALGKLMAMFGHSFEESKR
jgi:hypothetical protein